MSYEIEGKIKVIYDPQTFDSGFKKREFVITTEGKYPNDIKLEFTKGANADKDKCAILDKYEVGQSVKVSFDLRGNEWKDRYFVNLVAWKIEAMDASGESAPAPEQSEPEPEQSEPAGDEPEEGLPF